MKILEVVETIRKALNIAVLGPQISNLLLLALNHILSNQTDKSEILKQLDEFQSPSLKYILHEDKIQIIVCATEQNNPTEFKLSQIMVEVHGHPPNVDYTCDVETNLVDRPLQKNQTINANRMMGLLDKKLERTTPSPVIGFLGGVRQTDPKVLMNNTKKTVTALVDKFGSIGVLTAGYKGMQDNKYPITRAAYDACKTEHNKNRTATLTVMPNVGLRDMNTNANSIDVYGRSWGDDTPALIAAGDAFMVFAPYGIITELEIASALKNNKPVVVIDPNLNFDSYPYSHAHCGLRYEQPIVAYKSYEDAVKALDKQMANLYSNITQAPLHISSKLIDNHTNNLGSLVNFDFNENQWRDNFPNTEFIEQLKTPVGKNQILQTNDLEQTQKPDELLLYGYRKRNKKLASPKMPASRDKSPQTPLKKTTPQRAEEPKAKLSNTENQLHKTKNPSIKKPPRKKK